MCNDAEEREHIMHLLLRFDYVLSVDVEGNRYFGKFAEEWERDEFKYFKTLSESKKAEIQEMIARE